MRAGKLNEKISIHTPTISQNSTTGEVVQSWSTFIGDRWANVVISQGIEQFMDDQRHFRKEGTFTIRYSTGITPVMRIAYPSTDPTYFDIISITNVGNKNRELIIVGEHID